MQYSELIRNYIIDNFLFGDEDGLRDDTSFTENDLLESTGIMELVAYIEDNFKITVEDEELVPENLDSIKKVAEFIERKRVS